MTALTYFAALVVGGALGWFAAGCCYAARRADDESEETLRDLKLVRDETEVIDFGERLARNAESRGPGPEGAA